MIKLKNLLPKDNSDEIIKMIYTCSGLISPRGTVYSTSELGHADFLVERSEYKKFSNKLKKAHGDDWNILYHTLLEDALNTGWIRISIVENVIMINGRKDFIRKHSKIINDIIYFAESKKRRQINVSWEYVK